MLLLGAIIATAIQLLFGYYENWIAIFAIYILSLLYILYAVPESLNKKSRKPLTTKNYNPLRPLFHVMDNPIVGWVALVYFCTSLPQAGILGILLVFFSEQLDIKDDESVVVNAVFMVSVGVSALFMAVAVIPMLKRKFVDRQIVEIGIIASIICQFCFVGFAFYPTLPLVVAGGLLYFSVAVSNASLNAILTKYVRCRIAVFYFLFCFYIKRVNGKLKSAGSDFIRGQKQNFPYLDPYDAHSHSHSICVCVGICIVIDSGTMAL